MEKFVCELELGCTMGNTPSKSDSGDEPVRTTLFTKERSGTTYRIPALIYLRHSHTFLAFAEKRTSPSDSDAKILVMRRGTREADGSIQVIIDYFRLPNHLFCLFHGFSKFPESKVLILP